MYTDRCQLILLFIFLVLKKKNSFFYLHKCLVTFVHFLINLVQHWFSKLLTAFQTNFPISKEKKTRWHVNMKPLQFLYVTNYLKQCNSYKYFSNTCTNIYGFMFTSLHIFFYILRKLIVIHTCMKNQESTQSNA